MERITASGKIDCMYQVDPYMDYKCNVSLPNTMYRVENVHYNGVSCSNMCNQRNTCPDGAQEPVGDRKVSEDLVRRQGHIMEQLENMKNEIATLAKRVGFVFKTSEPKDKAAAVLEMPKVAVLEQLDLVISSEPSKPPVVAFLFYHLLKRKGYRISSPSYTHSSASSPPSDKWLKCISRETALRQGRGDLIMTFVWKTDQFSPSLTVAPNKNTCIIGSNNIARFLARQFDPSLYEGCGPDKAALIDGWLDSAVLQIVHGSPKEKGAALRSMNSQLGGSDWLVEGQMTIADLCAWSACLTSDTMTVDSLPKNVKRWFKKCSDCQPFLGLADALSM